MKNYRKCVAAMLVAVLLFACCPVASFAQTDTDGAFTYRVENGTAVLTGYDKSLSGTMIIPSSLGGNKLTKINGYALAYDDDVTRVEIPEGVTYIGEGAFNGYTALTEVEIPDSLYGLGRMPFAGSPWYEEKSKEDLVYVGNVLAAVNPEKVPAKLTLRDGTTGIAEYAFAGNQNLTEITLPDSCVYIGDSAFIGCAALQKVNLPEKMTCIDQNAFYSCSALTEISLPQGLLVLSNQMLGGTALQSVVIPEGVHTIGAGAFAGCASLKEITFPVSLALVNAAAFADCKALTTLYYGGTDEQYSAIMITPENNDILLALKYQDPVVQEKTLYKPLDGNMLAVPAGTTIRDYYNAINEDYYYVDDDSGKPITLEDKIRTQMAIRMQKKEYVAVVLGDSDGDGSVSSSDARITLRYSVGLEEKNEVVAAASDVDLDGTITASDARSVLRASVGLDDANAWFDKI